MKYLKKFQNHNGYESFVESEDFLKPNVSLCKTEWECHYTIVPYAERYLTFKILSGGTINWKASNTAVTGTVISYSKDNGETWTDITSSTAGTSFDVSAGDKVLFKGNNARYASLVNYSNTFGASTAIFNLEGNIMSLVSGDSFSAATELTSAYTFASLFRDSNVVNAKNLVLPATTLASYCYSYMFANCVKLNSITCLATNKSATSCVSYWVQSVASVGTFIKSPSITTSTWTRGNSGIPTNWTVLDAT